MAKAKVKGSGTKQSPWELTTPSGSSQYVMYRDETANPPALVCVVGKTELRYHLRAIDDLDAMLKKHGDWMALGSADEQKPAAEGTVEAWGRSPKNPVGGRYGMKKAFAAGSACTCRHCSKPSALRKSSTTRRTTGCGRSEHPVTPGRFLDRRSPCPPVPPPLASSPFSPGPRCGGFPAAAPCAILSG